MFKRLLLVAPLALVLAACGSSGNHNAPAAVAPATPATASRGAPTVPVTAATTTVTPAQAATTAAPSPAPAAAGSGAATAGAAPASGAMSAADRAAMAKAAQDFVDNGKWVEGTNYFVINPPQPKVGNSDKIEVVEVFSWGCPSCNAAHKIIDTLRAQLPPYATMDYLVAGFRPDENWPLYQRTWYAAKALGVARKSYDAMFDANWKTGETGSYNLATGQLKPRSEWPDIHTIAQFYSKQFGIAPAQFTAVAESFAINTQMKRADELVKDYKVAGTPTLVVNGRYRFDFNSAGGYTKGIELAKWLVAKEAKRLSDASATAR